MIPLYRILLYFPQAHSKSLLVQNSFTERPSRAQACAYGS
jgi:hypothetical protein